jgi:hypothetical protein
MRRSSRLVAAGVAAVLLLGGAGRAAADPYHNAEYKFNLTLPAGWRPMYAGEMKRFNDEQARGGTGHKNVAGFRPAGGDFDRGLFAIVKLNPDPAGMPFDEFEKMFTREYAEVTANRPDLQRVLGVPQFDRGRKRFTCHGLVGEGLAMRGGSYLGPDGLIIINTYSAEADLRRNEPTLLGLIDSFQFDGQEPPAAAPASSPAWLNGLGDNGRMALVGGITVVLVLVIGAVVLREKSDRRRSAW